MRFYHGTDLDTANRLHTGEPLDLGKAEVFKIDGPLRFFLATDVADAKFFALRQLRGVAAVLAFEISPQAITRLLAATAVIRTIPRGPRSPRFMGDELFIPPHAFELFNELVQAGEIRFDPTF